MNSPHSGIDISTETFTPDMVRHFICPIRYRGDMVKEFQKGCLCVHAFDRLGGGGSERDFVDRTSLKHMILPQPLKCWD